MFKVSLSVCVQSSGRLLLQETVYNAVSKLDIYFFI
jgi:hypothetical protein